MSHIRLPNKPDPERLKQLYVYQASEKGAPGIE